MTEPIRPDQALAKKAHSIPAYVIEAANDLLVRKVSLSGVASFTVPELADLAVEKAQAQGECISRNHLFENRWLDIEPVFREAGWKVQFIKTPYYDSNPDSFVFSKPA